MHPFTPFRQVRPDDTGALADYSQALALHPHDLAAREARAKFHQVRGHWRAAWADYDRYLELKPDAAALLANRAMLKEQLGVASATADYDRAVQLEPKRAEIVAARARSRQVRGELEGAVADFSQAIALHPKPAGYVELRGNTYYLARRWSDAVADYQKVIALEPERAWLARMHLWLLRLRMDEKERGDQELIAALESPAVAKAGPEYAGVLTLARYLAGRADQEWVLNMFQAEAQQPNADYCMATFFIGMRDLLAGDRASGIDWLQIAVRTGAQDAIQYHMALAELRRLNAVPAELEQTTSAMEPATTTAPAQH